MRGRMYSEPCGMTVINSRKYLSEAYAEIAEPDESCA